MSAQTTQLIGLALLHFFWQGALLALLLFIAVSLTRNPRVRYAAGVVTLALMAVCLPATLVFFFQPAAPATVGLEAPAVHSSVSNVTVALNNVAPISSFDLLTCFVWIWCGGVCLFSARAFGGWLMLQKLRRNAQSAIPTELLDRFHRLQKRMGLSRLVHYADSDSVEAPAVVGWFRPVVLIPLSAMSGLSVEQLDAVMAHELAHIRRYDAVVNLFQIAVETVLFYHPAVWWVNRVVRAERENCCDDVAVSMCGNATEYARALTAISGAQSAFAMGANGGVLKARIARLLGMKKISHAVPRAGLATLAVLCASCVLVAAAYRQDPPPPPPPAAPVPPTEPLTPEPPAPPAPPNPEDLTVRDKAELDQVQADLTKLEHELSAARRAHTHSSPEQLEELKRLQMRLQQGYQSLAESSEKYAQTIQVEVRKDIQDKELKALARAVASMKERYTPDYPELLEAKAKLDALTQAQQDQAHSGPSYIDSLASVGLTKLTVDELIALKVQGVTADYVKQIRAAGFDPKVHELIAMKVQGITPEFIEKVKNHGFKDVTIHQLINLKIAGVF